MTDYHHTTIFFSLERNDRLFMNRQSSIPHMLDKVKSYYFMVVESQ